jgi:hypothetical protein
MLKKDKKIILHLIFTPFPQFLWTTPHGLWSTQNLQESTTNRIGAI